MLGLAARCAAVAIGIATVTGCATMPLAEGADARSGEAPTPAGDDGIKNPILIPIGKQVDPFDAVVRIVGPVTCSGTLISEDLVLTAHHCVTRRGPHQEFLSEDVTAEEVRVELGGDDLPWGEVGVKAIVSAECGYEQGTGDLAILVLSRTLVGMPTLTAQIVQAPEVETEIHPWGFGRCAMGDGPIRRHARAGGKIDAVGYGVFRARAAICPGDSGGPVLTAAGEIVGVISAAVMDNNANTRDSAYFARLDKFHQLFAAAQEIAAGANPTELPPYRSCE